MEWIKILFPLVGVLIGWLLAESGKIFSDKRQDKRKLKSLLFYLLEFRYYFAKELSFELSIDMLINLIKFKLAERIGVNENDSELNVEFETWKPIIIDLINKSKEKNDKFEYLELNIDKKLIELSEIFPILAYELSGKHNIKERLNSLNNYFEEIDTLTPEMPFNISEWIKPRVTEDLLIDLDESLLKISSKINRSTKKEVKEKISNMKFDSDENEMNNLIDGFFKKIEDSLK